MATRRTKSSKIQEFPAFHGEGNPFSALSDEERRTLAADCRPSVFKKGQYLFRSGEPAQGIFSLSSGVVRITQAQGPREIVVRLASSGDWVGHRSIFTTDVYRGSAQAKERTHSLFVPVNALLRLFGSHKEFAGQLIRLIARDLENTERLLLEHQKLNVPSRLISLFRVLDEKLGQESPSGRALSTKLTKVEIAQMIGASQEVVSRQLSKWKEENLLREDGKRIFLSSRLLGRIIR